MNDGFFEQKNLIMVNLKKSHQCKQKKSSLQRMQLNGSSNQQEKKINNKRVYQLQSIDYLIALNLLVSLPTPNSMQLSKDDHTNYSQNSSRFSQSSNSVLSSHQVKKMQAKLLMDYYNQNLQLKHRKYLNQTYDKASYGNYEQSLNQNYKSQQQAKRRRNQEIKQTLAEEYNQIIRLKEQKIHEEKQKIIQTEKRNLQISPWGRDSTKETLKTKQMQQEYGKQLQMHIRLQQIQKYEQKIKEREAIEKYNRQQYQMNLNYDKNQIINFRRKQQFERRQNQILGISQVNPQSIDFGNRNAPLQKDEIRAFKRKEQLIYGTGLQQQLRSKTISPKMNDLISLPKMNDRTSLAKMNDGNEIISGQTNRKSQKKLTDSNMFGSQVYNPITNPIQISYKNPYVLRMLAEHNR